MLNEKENVVEEITENVEATTEETTERVGKNNSPEKKVYTESEFKQKLTDGINKAISRREGKLRKEFENEYGELIKILKSNIGEDDIKKVTEEVRKLCTDETQNNRQLLEIGVSEDVYNSAEFKSFASKFNSDTPITDIYNIYNQITKPQKQVQQMGSLKSTTSGENDIKDFYSYDEASKFTNADFEKNPKLFEAVKNSMRKWK